METEIKRAQQMHRIKAVASDWIFTGGDPVAVEIGGVNLTKWDDIEAALSDLASQDLVLKIVPIVIVDASDSADIAECSGFVQRAREYHLFKDRESIIEMEDVPMQKVVIGTNAGVDKQPDGSYKHTQFERDVNTLLAEGWRVITGTMAASAGDAVGITTHAVALEREDAQKPVTTEVAQAATYNYVISFINDRLRRGERVIDIAVHHEVFNINEHSPLVPFLRAWDGARDSMQWKITVCPNGDRSTRLFFQEWYGNGNEYPDFEELNSPGGNRQSYTREDYDNEFSPSRSVDEAIGAPVDEDLEEAMRLYAGIRERMKAEVEFGVKADQKRLLKLLSKIQSAMGKAGEFSPTRASEGGTLIVEDKANIYLPIGSREKPAAE